jgi:tetratricopeptide (TPR) repeat protein
MAMLDQADAAFKAGDTALGQGRLELAVGMSPNDPAVLLRAGDIALANHLAVYALEHFYLPAFNLTKPQEPPGNEVRARAALAYYVAAADPATGPFLDGRQKINPESEMAALALARHKIFSGELLAASNDLKSLTAKQPDSPAVLLIAGDWYLAQGQLKEAESHYQKVADSKPAPGGSAFPFWVVREATCHLRQLRDPNPNLKLEATCEDLSLLVTGR